MVPERGKWSCSIEPALAPSPLVGGEAPEREARPTVKQARDHDELDDPEGDATVGVASRMITPAVRPAVRVAGPPDAPEIRTR